MPTKNSAIPFSQTVEGLSAENLQRAKDAVCSLLIGKTEPFVCTMETLLQNTSDLSSILEGHSIGLHFTYVHEALLSEDVISKVGHWCISLIDKNQNVVQLNPVLECSELCAQAEEVMRERRLKTEDAKEKHEKFLTELAARPKVKDGKIINTEKKVGAKVTTTPKNSDRW